MRHVAGNMIGMTSGSGRKKVNMDTRWWNEEGQDSIKRKKQSKKKWDSWRDNEIRWDYREIKQIMMREVVKSKEEAYAQLNGKLNTKEGERVHDWSNRENVMARIYSKLG